MRFARKSAPVWPYNNASRGLRIAPGIGGPAGIRTQDQGIHVTPPFPAGADYLFTRGNRAVRVRDALACHQGHWKPSGSLCTVRRCTAGLAQDRHQPPRALEGFPEFIPSTRSLSGPRHLSQKDESPALTTELQARGKSSKMQLAYRYESFSSGCGSRAGSVELRQSRGKPGRHPQVPQRRSCQ